tara:strand:+ start:495 stop:926 length:432 start_codon:yes stop_codon:yes gene_type:complete
MYSELKEEIKKHEGWSPKIYKDHLGFDTIFYGHLITPEDTYEHGQEYSRSEGSIVFEKDFQKAVGQAESLIGERAINHIAKQVIIQMVYQLGVGGVSKFKKMWAALDTEDYETAGNEMLDSKWADQTPHRCAKLSVTMKTAKL